MSKLTRTLMAALIAALPLALGVPGVSAQTEPEKFVSQADKTLQSFLGDPEMAWLSENIGRAKAVLIAPEIVKAGFILGGSGGRALLVAKDEGSWRGPAFYTLATASVGFQAGVSVSDMVMLVMSDRGLNSVLSSSFKLGADVSMAAGPVGAGAKSNIVADLVAFTRAKGVYGGLTLDGTVVKVGDEWNTAYYGQKVQPMDILIKKTVSNQQADALLGTVAKAAGGK